MAHLFTDADNTLWDTNSVFARAQVGLLRAIECRTGISAPRGEDQGLSFLRAVDQRIAEVHSDHLRYPPKLLVSGIIEALQGRGANAAAKNALAKPSVAGFDAEIDAYLLELGALPPLREGVAETLKAASELGVPITVVSEERRERCEVRLAAHDLAALVADVVSAPKSLDLYRRLRREAPSRWVAMVGDQPDRDISPAKRAGFWTFLFPSAFAPYWSSRTRARPTRVLHRFDELIPLLAENRREISLAIPCRPAA